MSAELSGNYPDDLRIHEITYPGVARSQQKKIKNQEKDAQPEKKKRKIHFSDLRYHKKKFYAAVWRGRKI